MPTLFQAAFLFNDEFLFLFPISIRLTLITGILILQDLGELISQNTIRWISYIGGQGVQEGASIIPSSQTRIIDLPSHGSQMVAFQDLIYFLSNFDKINKNMAMTFGPSSIFMEKKEGKWESILQMSLSSNMFSMLQSTECLLRLPKVRIIYLFFVFTSLIPLPGPEPLAWWKHLVLQPQVWPRRGRELWQWWVRNI